MDALGILRASSLLILASAFQGHPVSCDILNRILSSKKSSTVEVSEDHESSNVKSSSGPSSPLPQSALVFENATWDDSHLASAFLFINEFCKDAISKKFKGQVKVLNDVKDNEQAKRLSGKVKSLCSSFSSYLESLSANLVPGGATINPYKDALKPEKFRDYIEWLEKHLPGIRTSFKNMFNESKKLNKDQLKTKTSVGPLKYGFKFVGDKWDSSARRNLRPITKNLITTIRFLQKYLDEILKSFPEDSTVKPKVSEASEVDAKSEVNPQQDGSVVNEDEIPM